MSDSRNVGDCLARRARAIELLVLDVDGVLTDGRIIYGCGPDNPEGWVELKQFHVRDGSGLKMWHQAGKRSALLTGRRSPVVDARAAELGIGQVIQGAADKGMAFEQLLARAELPPEAVCYVGDDLPDLPPLDRAGLAVAVADACPEVRAAAHYQTRWPGGGGAVREVIELLLRCQGTWTGLVARLLQG